MRVSKVELVTLGLVAEGPAYGYELLERLRSRGMVFWVEVGKASVYQALRRLEERGLIAGRAQEGTEGPDRRVYRLTAAGRARLRAGLLALCADAGPYEVDAGVGLGFAHLLTPDEARRAVGARAAAVREWRTAVAEERERAASATGPGRAIALRLLELQDALARTEQRWLASFADELGELRRSV
jgi:DNA-binding PadR family transcriptional regulator